MAPALKDACPPPRQAGPNLPMTAVEYTASDQALRGGHRWGETTYATQDRREFFKPSLAAGAAGQARLADPDGANLLHRPCASGSRADVVVRFDERSAEHVTAQSTPLWSSRSRIRFRYIRSRADVGRSERGLDAQWLLRCFVDSRRPLGRCRCRAKLATLDPESMMQFDERRASCRDQCGDLTTISTLLRAQSSRVQGSGHGVIICVGSGPGFDLVTQGEVGPGVPGSGGCEVFTELGDGGGGPPGW
jgi:hypothetical protein